ALDGADRDRCTAPLRARRARAIAAVLPGVPLTRAAGHSSARPLHRAVVALHAGKPDLVARIASDLATTTGCHHNAWTPRGPGQGSTTLIAYAGRQAEHLA